MQDEFRIAEYKLLGDNLALEYFNLPNEYSNQGQLLGAKIVIKKSFLTDSAFTSQYKVSYISYHMIACTIWYIYIALSWGDSGCSNPAFPR